MDLTLNFRADFLSVFWMSVLCPLYISDNASASCCSGWSGRRDEKRFSKAERRRRNSRRNRSVIGDVLDR